MAIYFVGQVMMTGYPFAAKGFALANGQLMPISQNQALFSLLGTQYGGDGRATFQLPNLQGRAATGAGLSADPDWSPEPYVQGTPLGSETVTLTLDQLPLHNHQLNASTTAGTLRPVPSAMLSASSVSTEPAYGGATALQPLADTTIASSGGGGAHANMQPFTVINFQIALAGVFPSRQ
ncbi:phage tail protein [Caulobacter sp.]|uniref:phage tail protein n=1 Tax=Caulobacter sp. TaxID=78 RepID=UPI002B46449C|nr:tail fiber protein [Caulobacter sp.]HJV41339.1 tail fiber protein [Caulobacter sp.]